MGPSSLRSSRRGLPLRKAARATRAVSSGTGWIGLGLSDTAGLRGGSDTDSRDIGRPAGPARFRQQYRRWFLGSQRGPGKASVCKPLDRQKSGTLYRQGSKDRTEREPWDNRSRAGGSPPRARHNSWRVRTEKPWRRNALFVSFGSMSGMLAAARPP